MRTRPALVLSLALIGCTAAKSAADIPVDAGGRPSDGMVSMPDASEPQDAAVAPSEDASEPEDVDVAPAEDSAVREDGAPDEDAATPLDAASPGTYRDAILASGPIAYWPFDETSGTESRDIVGARILRSAGAVMMSEPSLIVADGDAIRFSGSSWAAMDAHDPTLQHNPYSVEMWLRHDAVSEGNTIASMQGPNARGWVLGSQLFGLTCDQGNTSGEWLALPRITYAAATVYHVVFSFDGTTMQLYVDGALQGSVPGGFVPSDNPLAVGGGLCANCATGGFCSGCESGAAARGFWEGAMDELAYYDRALTAEEIATHHERGRGP